MRIIVEIPGMEISKMKELEMIVVMIENLVKSLVEKEVVPVDSVFSVAFKEYPKNRKGA